MDNLIDSFSKKVNKPKILQREDLAGEVELMNLEMPSYPKSSKFFNVTDFCKPMNFFMEEKRNMKRNPEIKKYFSRGNRAHFLLQNILKRDKDYSAYEGVLDGYYKGIFVRGKIDLKIGDSLIEIKSKEKEFIPSTPEEILSSFKSELEQICVYSAIDPREPKENYLIFVSQDLEKISAFKVKILDMEEIKKRIRKRVEKIKLALKNDDPGELKSSCRYCGHYCNLFEKCEFKNLDKLDFEFSGTISVERDYSMEKKIQELKKESYNPNFYIPYYLICPRKSFFIRNAELSSKEFEHDINKIYFDELVFNYKYSKDDGTKVLNKQSRLKEFNLSKSKWFLDKNSKNPSGDYLPYITHASASNNTFSLNSPSPYKLTELGIILSIYGLSKGLIFQYYPNLNNKIKVFEISFSSLSSFFEDVQKMVNLSNDSKNVEELPKCPDYFCKDCDYKDECK